MSHDSQRTLSIEDNIGTLLNKDGSIQTVVDLNWLASVMMNNGRLTRTESQVAALAIRQLMNLKSQQGATA